MFCKPSTKLAVANMDLSDVKSKCSSEADCAHFFKNGKSGVYYKCDARSSIKDSGIGSILYPKGINSFWVSLIGNKTVVFMIDENFMLPYVF